MEPDDFVLTFGVLETGDYGNRFNAALAPDGQVQGSFLIEGDPEDLVLRFDGFDIDDAEELQLFINGVDLGTMPAGLNEGLASYQVALTADLLQTGSNEIIFQKTGNPAYKWGVTNILIEPGVPIEPGPGPDPVPSEPDDFVLTFGVLETGDYGNRFNAALAPDGQVQGSFLIEGDPEDLVLRFDGFDIDDAEELQLFINGVDLGTMPAGLNEGLASYQVALTADLLQTGSNEIIFQKTGNPAYKWGVTNILIEPGVPIEPGPGPDPVPSEPDDFVLTFGVLETGDYGNRFNAALAPDGQVQGSFLIEGDPEDLVLRFDGFDIDDAEELQLFINGVDLGTMPAGLNEGLASYQVALTADLLQTGSNEIIFQKTGNPAYKWGVTNILIEPGVPIEPGPGPDPVPSEPDDFVLTFGVLETGDYGNRFNAALAPDGQVQGSFLIEGDPEDLVLRFDGFDIDDAEELQLFINGVDLGTMPAGLNEGLASYQVALTADLLQTGSNEIIFQKTGNPAYKWGVTNILIEPGVPIEPGPGPDPVPSDFDISVIAEYDGTLWFADDPSGAGMSDPAGIAYIPGLDLLFIGDSEHNESPFNSPINLFAVRTDGTYVGAYSLRDFTDEPTGLAYNPLDGLLYIADDDQRKVFVVDPLNPETLIREIDLSALGDAEEPTFDPVTGNMYIMDGANTTLFEFSPTGDIVSAVGLPSEITDAEGLVYNPKNETFFVSGGDTDGEIFLIDKNGNLLGSNLILNDETNPKNGGSEPELKGFEIAPSSDPNDGDKLSLYAVDYGDDQFADGRLFELNFTDEFYFV